MGTEDKKKHRKKKHSKDIGTVRGLRFGYNQYVDRKSIFDQVSDDSLISQSPFKGILRLVLVATFAFAMNNFLVKITYFCNLCVCISVEQEAESRSFQNRL